jgi:hypothetical protein
MSPDGIDQIPSVIRYLDAARYSDSQWLAAQPVIVRVGLGLLVLDVVPLALDVLIVKLILGGGGGGAKADAAKVEMSIDVLDTASACKFFEANPGLVTARSKDLVGAFYRDFFKGVSADTAPEVLLFEAVASLSPAFAMVINALVEQRLVRSAAVQTAVMQRVPAMPRGSDALRRELQRAVAADRSGVARRLVGDPALASVLSSSLLGTLYVCAGRGGAEQQKVVLGIKGAAQADGQSLDLEQAALDLYIIRRLLQSLSPLPPLAAKAASLGALVGAELDAALQLRRVFDARAGGLYGAGEVAIVPFSSVYSDSG